MSKNPPWNTRVIVRNKLASFLWTMVYTMTAASPSVMDPAASGVLPWPTARHFTLSLITGRWWVLLSVSSRSSVLRSWLEVIERDALHPKISRYSRHSDDIELTIKMKVTSIVLRTAEASADFRKPKQTDRRWRLSLTQQYVAITFSQASVTISCQIYIVLTRLGIALFFAPTSVRWFTMASRQKLASDDK